MTEEAIPVQCQICREHIGNIRALRQQDGTLTFPDLRIPLVGAMFLSPDPGHGILPPFHETHTWDMFRCPHGGHRPIVTPNKILTGAGIVVVEPDKGAVLGAEMTESDRSWIMDRAVDEPRAVSDEEAAAEYRRREAMGRGPVVGEESTEAKDTAKNEDEEQSDGSNGGADGEREAGAGGEGEATGKFVCDRCKNVFRSRSGLMRHRKQVHGLRTAWGGR